MATRRRAIGLAALIGFLAITAWSAGFVPSTCCSAACERCPASVCKATASVASPKGDIASVLEPAGVQAILFSPAPARAAGPTSILPSLSLQFLRPMRN